MTAPVRRLTITHPDLPNPVEVPLPWDAFPRSLQDGLDALDTNDDGAITYSPVPGGPTGTLTAEAHHADDSADRLNRIFLGYAGTNPHNSRLTDRSTAGDRWRTTRAIQNSIHDNVVQPLLGDGSDLSKWRQAQRILSETGDFIHLRSLAVQARARWGSTHNIEFLRIAEGMLLAAKRFDASVHAERLADVNQTFRLIENELSQIGQTLDQADRASFRENLRHPYLMATIGSPISADLATLQRQDGMVYFGVAVPRSFVQANQSDLNAAIVRYFNRNSSVMIRGSRFQDGEGSQEFRLTAAVVERDAPGSADDRIDSQSSFHLDQARLQRTAFRGQEEMVFYRVGFQAEHPAEILGSRPIRKFDLLIRRDETVRTVPGGVVLQNLAGQDSRDVFASDLHVSERDYEIVRLMSDSLRSLAARYERDHILPERVPVLRSQAEEVERFYESVNEQVEAAVDQWNQDYRTGGIHRVFLAGDLADFVNIARTMERQGYRSGNIRRLREILGRIEAPLFVVSGNHDHHGQRFPLSLHLRNFINAGDLQGLYADHYDHHRFPDSILYLEGVKALLPASSSNEGWFPSVVRELSADNPFGPPNDDFLDHHMREIGIYETYGVGLGNGFRVFAWPTETEHFNYARYLLEEVHEPVAPGVINGISQYIGQQHVNGKGPRPETFVAFLREMEAAQRNNQRLILMGHYPAFYAGEGPDQTPDSVDALRGDVSWAVRMASWYYRRSDGEAVMSLSVAGHVHHYGESDFTLRFANAHDENHFRRELGAILARKNADTVFNDLHHLRHDWDLDNRIEIRRVQDAGSDGFPGPILRDLNNDSSSYCRRRGTAFLNLATLGVPIEDGSGYVILTTHPNGRVEATPRLIRVAPQGNVITANGNQLEAFRRSRWNEARNWDATRTIAPFQAHSSPTAVSTTGPGTPGMQRHWDFFPLVYQYPRGTFALTLDGGLEWDGRSGRVGPIVGGQLLFPTSREIHTVFGGPNYIALGAEYSGINRDLRVRLGLDWGLPTTYLTIDRLISGNPAYGAEILIHGIFPHAGFAFWGQSDKDRNWAAGLNFRLTLPVVTLRPSDGEHAHL